jgi:hypothetical protein
MDIPVPPWYKGFEQALSPIEGHTTAVLLAIAGITVVIALRGDAVTKLAWLVYLISP